MLCQILDGLVPPDGVQQPPTVVQQGHHPVGKVSSPLVLALLAQQVWEPAGHLRMAALQEAVLEQTRWVSLDIAFDQPNKFDLNTTNMQLL
jgi:hypothetical protein